MPTTHYTDASFGFHMFNTSTLHDPYDANDKPIEKSMSEGLIVDATPEHAVISGYDFLGHKLIAGQSYDIAMPKASVK